MACTHSQSAVVNGAARIKLLRGKLAALRAQAFLVSDPHNVAYLSGFESSNGYLLISDAALFVITDFRYQDVAERVARRLGGTAVLLKGGGLAQALRDCCTRLRIRALAFEPHHLTVAQFRALERQASGIRWMHTTQVVAKIRAAKDRAEIRAIRLAIAVAEQAYAGIPRKAWLGLTEIEAADLLEARIRAAGRRNDVRATPSFDTIVAEGPHVAEPHHLPTQRRIGAGEMVTFDWGARVNGYCSDITRTIMTGRADAQFRRIYQTVRDAQAAAIRAVKPRVALKTIDAAAREIITRAGHAKQFGHGTGHGVGRQVHEGIAANMKSKDVAAPGMVLTIEPGIYISGWGGVRIEDMVLVTRTGAEVLTSLPK